MELAILGLLISLVSPIFLLPIEKLLPYPYFIEEAVKLVVVLLIIKSEVETKKSLLALVFLGGILFTLSESVFYLVNIFALGDLMVFPKRLVLTGGLHTWTAMSMYFLSRKSYLGLMAGFIRAVVIHYFFNLWVVG